MRSSAELTRPIANAYDPDNIAVLLTKERHSADLLGLRLAHLLCGDFKIFNKK